MNSVCVLAAICGFSWSGHLLADLEEKDFPSAPGELNRQNRWEVQRSEAGVWAEALDAVQVESEESGDNIIAWQPGNGGKEQVRVVRAFAPTVSEKVLIRFAFKPGSENLGGRLYFCQTGNNHILALQFLNGHVHVLESGQAKATDTGIVFSPDAWNTIEIRLDFSRHIAELVLNGAAAGQYEISPGVSSMGLVNLFGGGATHGSALKNLTVLSVSDFSSSR